MRNPGSTTYYAAARYVLYYLQVAEVVAAILPTTFCATTAGTRRAPASLVAVTGERDSRARE